MNENIYILSKEIEDIEKLANKINEICEKKGSVRATQQMIKIIYSNGKISKSYGVYVRNNKLIDAKLENLLEKLKKSGFEITGKNMTDFTYKLKAIGECYYDVAELIEKEFELLKNKELSFEALSIENNDYGSYVLATSDKEQNKELKSILDGISLQIDESEIKNILKK